MRNQVNLFKRWLRRIILGYDVPTYFYSKSGEDAILFNLFYNKLANRAKGFYVDIGAHHPTFQSNTFLFYKNGWSGINIDADPDSINQLAKNRKRDINLNIGVGEKSSSLTFYRLEKGYETMNSFSLKNLKDLGIENKIRDEIKIQVKPLKLILEETLPKGKAIDFIDIDVEGMDLDVLKSNDWNQFRPKVVLIEADKRNISEIIQHPIYTFLKSVDYELIAKTSFISDLGTLIFEDQKIK